MSNGDRGKHNLNLRGKWLYAPPADKDYRTNYDRIFGKREKPEDKKDSKGDQTEGSLD